MSWNCGNDKSDWGRKSTARSIVSAFPYLAAYLLRRGFPSDPVVYRQIAATRARKRLALPKPNRVRKAFLLIVALASGTSETVAATETTNYQYDALGRLVGSSISGTVNNGVQTSMAYDAADNRTNVTVTNSGGAPPPPPPVTPTVSISSSGGDPNTTIVFPVTLSSATTNTVTVSYATANGTASAPGNYTAASGTVSFAPGQTSSSISILAKANNTIINKTFTVTLSSPSGATLGTPQATGTVNGTGTSCRTC